METILDQPENRKENFSYASFWIRFAAIFIDALILSVTESLAVYIFFGSRMDSDFNTFSLILGWLYFAGMESSSNMGTIGKIIMGIKVVNEQGERISFLNATGRYFAKIISAAILFIGFIMAAYDVNRQALHDKLAKTFVIYKS